MNSYSPLHVAVSLSNPNLDIIRELIKNGANIEALDVHKRTPLQAAKYFRRNEAAQLLEEAEKYLAIQDVCEQDTPTFINYFQWLPQEMINETCALGLNTPDEEKQRQASGPSRI